jgi:5-methylcytosine-specific restriction endonuclease McrA
MLADQTFTDAKAFAAELRRLRAARQNGVAACKAMRQKRCLLTKTQRAEVLRKAAGRCHICGGLIDGSDWEADHVFAHSSGGLHSIENYLPAHSICNNYRWFYGTQEFQWILKLGVWLRTKIENREKIGLEVAKHFTAHDRRRAKRRLKSALSRGD